MRKSICEVIAFIFLLLLPMFSNAQIDSLWGNVKEVIQTEKNFGGIVVWARDSPNYGQYSLDEETIFSELPLNQRPERKIYISDRWQYDKNRRLTYESKNYDGRQIQRTYEYDSLGNKISTRVLSDDYFSSEDKYAFYYFSDGNTPLLKRETSYRHSDSSYTEYYYDSLRNNIKVKKVYSDGEIQQTTFEYDVYGKVIREKYMLFGSDGTLRQRDFNDTDTSLNYVVELNEYDQLARRVRKINRFAHGELNTVNRFEYDINNRIKKLFCYDDKKLVAKKEYDYNVDGTIKNIKRFQGESSESDNYVEYFYDENKLLNGAKFLYEGAISTIDFYYTFDSRGNWIQQIKTMNGKKVRELCRLITYY